MSDEARTAVLDRLRRALGRDAAADEAARKAVEERLGRPSPGLIPKRADLPSDERIALFSAQAEAAQARVERLARVDEIPAAVEAYLRAHNLPMQMVAARDPWLDGADWRGSMLEVRYGRAEETDGAGLTTAFAGIAETGTLMLLSDERTPTTVAFLPDNVIVALPSARVLRAYEDGFALLRETHGALPRSVNLVTGPSRTGDIEQTILLGAHGPRRLLVLLIDEAATGDGD